MSFESVRRCAPWTLCCSHPSLVFETQRSAPSLAATQEEIPNGKRGGSAPRHRSRTEAGSDSRRRRRSHERSTTNTRDV